MGDIKASPRNRLLGLLADATQGVNEFASKPFGYNNPPGAMLAGLFGLPGLSNTMNELSYGGALGTGSGMTWKPKADTVDAAMTLLPLGATIGKATIEKAPAAVARMAENAMVPRTLSPQAGALRIGDKKFAYPQEQALLTAQKNAALPVEQGGLGLRPDNTPMERAKAMGATEVFHGTVDDIRQLDPRLYGSSTGSTSAKQAFWTVDDPQVAETYANYAATYAPVQKVMNQVDAAEKLAQRTGNWDRYDSLLQKAESLESEIASDPLRGQNVMPLMVMKKGPVMDASGESFHGVEGDINQFLRNSRKQGAATISNLDDAAGRVDMPANHTAVFDPSLLRSRFAAFDPMRRHEADLLGRASPGLLGLLAGGTGAGVAGYNWLTDR